jgi:hypothetical protein
MCKDRFLVREKKCKGSLKFWETNLFGERFRYTFGVVVLVP